MISTKKYICSCLRSAPRRYPAEVPARAESPGGCTAGRAVAAYSGALVSPPPQRNEPDILNLPDNRFYQMLGPDFQSDISLVN